MRGFFVVRQNRCLYARRVPERKRPSSRVVTRLARERLKRGVTQEELAHATGLSVRAIQDLERGSRGNPGIRQVVAIAAAFGLDWKEIDKIAEPEWLEGYRVHLVGRAPALEYVTPVKQRPGRFIVEDG